MNNKTIKKYFEKSKIFYFIFLLGILTLTFLLSSRMILAGDFYYLFDQARDYLLAQDIVKTHDITLIGTHSGLGGFFHGPLWLYILAPVYLIGNGNPLAFAYFYIFLALITVFTAFIIGKKLYGTKGGLLISLIISLSPAIWKTVPNFIGVNLIPLVFLGLLYFLIKYIRGKQNYFIGASFLAGISLQFEALLPLAMIPVMIFTYFLNIKAIKNIKLILLSILSFAISISTFIIFDLRHNFLMTNAVLGTFIKGERAKGYLVFSERISTHLKSLFGVYKGILFNKELIVIALLFIIIIFAAYLIFKNNSKYKKEFFYLLSFPILIFIIFIFYPYQIWPEYVFGLIVPVGIAFYLAILTVWKKIIGKIFVILFFIVSFISVGDYLNSQYLKTYIPNPTSGSYLNQKEVIQWIYEDASDGKSGYFVYSTSVYTHGPDYLVDWMSSRYPNKELESQKQKINYLILYPYLENDVNAHEFWKENTLKTNGKVILRKPFKGGIIVEKIEIEDEEPEVDPNYYQGLIFR